MLKFATVLLAAIALAGVSHARTLDVAPGPDAQERIQTALLDAKPGDTVQLAAGRYELTDGLSLDVNNVTVKGAGPQTTVLSFKGQQGAGDDHLDGAVVDGPGGEQRAHPREPLAQADRVVQQRSRRRGGDTRHGGDLSGHGLPRVDPPHSPGEARPGGIRVPGCGDSPERRRSARRP